MSPGAGRSSPRRLALALLPLTFAWLLVAAGAEAKETGVHSPGGRAIYGADASFAEVAEQSRRNFVVEMVTGIAPEGNLGLLVGVLNQPVRGLEFYGGFGFEATPATNYPVSARYWFDILGYRPFVSLGYSLRSLSQLGIVSHNVFAEAGYKWQFHETYHVTLGLGARRPLAVVVTDDSTMHGPTVDAALLEEQKERSKIFVPTISLRFSRAF